MGVHYMHAIQSCHTYLRGTVNLLAMYSSENAGVCNMIPVNRKMKWNEMKWNPNPNFNPNPNPNLSSGEASGHASHAQHD